ncbi:MAG: 16S rRNA (guanine(966)-N(2))-methyltransferase RsmD [Pseudomonadota bacterium]
MTRHKPRGRGRSRRQGEARANRFRIIGGRWRGRRLAFPDGQDLRPTGDRVRETLFNWLAPLIEGARCLDLYAGSGALGLEALSRGAASCTFVDTDSRACAAIAEHLALLDATGGEVVRADALQILRRAPERPFDLVLLDPPFAADHLSELCTLLESHDWLVGGARVYLECPAAAGEPALPDNWSISRSGRAGNVGFFLCIRD